MRALLALMGAVVACAPGEQLVGDQRGRALLPTRFGLPVADPAAIDGRIGADHDPVVQVGLAYQAICTDYAGRPFPHCYDEHRGTDLLLRGGFAAMDAGSVEVLAAFDGVVVEAVDGNYDRCRIDQGAVSCDGHPRVANKVVLEHADGVRSMYLHLMKGSVQVEVGDRVSCGQPLGRIGSSGNSSLPHLHFEVRIDDFWTDPFAGPWSQPESLWEEQGVGEALPGAGCTAASADTGP